MAFNTSHQRLPISLLSAFPKNPQPKLPLLLLFLKPFFAMQLNKIFFIIIGFSATFTFSCRTPCDDKNHNKGIVDKALGDVTCTLVSPTIKGMIIDRQGQFDSLFTDTITGTCTKVPIVDFDKFTVLGLKAFGTCRSGFTREVIESVVKKKYIYKVHVTNCGNCPDSTGSYNWITIPKRKDGYLISFEVLK